MKQRTKQTILVMLAAVMLMLAACGQAPQTQQPDASPSPGEPGAATGRYIEEKLSLPDGMVPRSVYQAKDGTIYAYAMNMVDYGVAILTSTDGGDSFEQAMHPWLQELLSKNTVDSVAFDENGALLMAIVPMDLPQGTSPGTSGEPTPSTEPANEDNSTPAEGEGDAPAEGEGGDAPAEDEAPQLSFSGNMGSLQERSNTIIRGDKNGYTELSTVNGYIYSLSYGAGYLLCCTGESITVLEVATGKTLGEVTPPTEFQYANNYITDGQTIAAKAGERMATFDLFTGDLINEYDQKADESDSIYVSFGGNDAAFTLQNDGSAYLHGDNTGVFRFVPETGVTEQLIDGELTSLGLPSCYLMSLLHLDNGNILVQCSEGDSVNLYRYHFDPDAPRVPSQELRAYALEDNLTLRQAIGQYQLDHPDVRIKLEIGMSDGVSAADALRTLSNELLAGRGPDVLLLDDMPAQSYIAKGVLKDLSALFGSDIENGSYLANVANAFAQDGKLYAFPARFKLNMVLSPAATAPQTLEEILALVSANPKQASGIDNHNLVRVFYNALINDWINENGSLNEENLRRDLAMLGQLAQMNPDGALSAEEMAYVNEYMETLGYSAFNWAMGESALAFGNVGSFYSLSTPYSILTSKTTESFTLSLDVFGSSFLPTCVLGINSASTKQSLAEDFIVYAVGPVVAGYSLDEGFPVHKEALQLSAANPYGEGMHGAMATSVVAADVDDDGDVSEPEMFYLEINWPKEEYIDAFMQKIEGLTSPSHMDLSLKTLIIDETRPFLLGEKTLDETLSALNGKLNLLLSE